MAAEESLLGRPFMHSFSNHSQQVIEQLNVQRYYGTFTDVVIRVNDVDFKLHKCFLAACSAKFQAMLFSLRQECSNVIDLKEISATGFRYIVDYLYTGVLKMDPLCAQDVLVAAQFLELRDVEKVVLEFFKNIGSDAPMPPTEAALSLMRMSQGVGLTSVSNNEYQEVVPHEVQEAPAPQVAPPVVDVQVPSEQQTQQQQQQQQQLIEQQQQQQQVAPVPETTTRTSLPSLPQTWPVHLPTSHAQPAAVPGMYPTGAPYDGSCFEEYLKIIESFQGQSELAGGQATAMSRQQLFGQMQRPIGMMAATMKHGLDPSSYVPAMATTTVTTTLPPLPHPTPPPIHTNSASVPQAALAIPTVNQTVAQRTANISTAPENKPLTATPFLRQAQREDEEEEEEEEEEDDFDEDGVSITEEEPEEDAIPKVETMLLKLRKQEASSYKVVKITGEELRVQDTATASAAADADPAAVAETVDDEAADNVLTDVKEETSRESSPNEDITSNSNMAKEIAIQTSSASYIRKMKKRFKKFSSKKGITRKSTQPGTALQVPCKRKRGRPRKKTMIEPQEFLSKAHQMEEGSNQENNFDCEDELSNDEGNDDDYVPEADLEIDLMEIKSKPLKKRLKDEKLMSKRSSRKKKVKRVHDCSHCGRQFGKHEALRRHMQMHESIVMYSCHICAQKYVRPTELTQHMRLHTAEKYTCADCNLEYKDPRLYKKHMITKHGESKPFHCNFDGCGFSSNRPSNVEKHAVIHSGVKTYSCSNCGKCFAQPNGLQSHMKSCYQKRGYLCDFCGQKFNYLQSMKSHRLLHTGEKPHICPDCGARFADQRNFKRHRRIHENTYPYSCSCCDKKFRHSNSLKAHLNIHRKHQAQELQALHVMNFTSVNSSNSQPGTQEVGLKSYPQAQSHQPVYPQLVTNPEATCNSTLPTPTPPPQSSLQPPVTPASQSHPQAGGGPATPQHVQPSTTPHPVQSPMPTSISLPLSMSITMTSPPPQTGPLPTPLPAPFPMTLQGHLQGLPPGVQGNLQVHHVHGSIPMSAMTVAPAHMLPLAAGAYESAGIKYLEKPTEGQMQVAVQPQVHSALSLSHPGMENTGT